MNVYFIPLASGRFEPYYEQEGADEPTPAGQPSPGTFARLTARFSQVIRDAERDGDEDGPDPPRTTAMSRLKRRMMGWVAERVAEQRLLWQLRRTDRATLHVPEDMDPATALRLLHRGLQKDADRHLRLLMVHSLGLLASAPFVVLPGPNLFGYFFTFTVVGHFLAFRGARRGGSTVMWDVAPHPALTSLGRAVTTAPPERHRLILEAAEQLRLPRVARFVERMAARPA
ncbi:MAG: mitochondrial K+-H+ exchange-related family protein [Acidobacteriota bacterium]|nr:mitochondrial K+-H+ exchange-related family protein [Acidobacteriota bacterium]